MDSSPEKQKPLPEDEDEKLPVPEEAFQKGSLLEQWIDEYFMCYFPRKCDNKRADQIIHGMINMLLKTGE